MSQQLFDIEDAMFYPLTDPGDECDGGANPPVFGPGIDIGCVQTLTLTENRTEAEQPGDAGVCAKANRTKDYTGQVVHGGLNPTLLESMIGAARTTYTTGGGIEAVRSHVNQADPKAQGAIIAKMDSHNEQESTHIIVWNVQVASKPDINAANAAFWNTPLNIEGQKSLYAAHNCKGWYDTISFDEVVEIPAAFPGTTDYPV